MSEKILLDIACDKLRKAIANNTVTTRNIEIARKWARMALVSTSKKRSYQ